MQAGNFPACHGRDLYLSSLNQYSGVQLLPKSLSGFCPIHANESSSSGGNGYNVLHDIIAPEVLIANSFYITDLN
jgi:hypothetical protein